MKKYAEAVFRLVQEAHDHPTVEQLYTQLKPMFPGISLATVYNNLNALSEKGLVRRIPSAGAPDRYDRVHRHDHMICRQCGAISDISLKDMTDHFRREVGEGFLSYQVQVDWMCPACRGAVAEPETPEIRH